MEGLWCRCIVAFAMRRPDQSNSCSPWLTNLYLIVAGSFWPLVLSLLVPPAQRHCIIHLFNVDAGGGGFPHRAAEWPDRMRNHTRVGVLTILKTFDGTSACDALNGDCVLFSMLRFWRWVQLA